MANQSTSSTADWNRREWLAFADHLLDGAMARASENNARISLPGAPGGYGSAVDGLEGFARTFLLAGFRIAGERGIGVDGLIDFYSRGIVAGVDPEAPDRWVRLDEHPQAKVEAASLALILDMTRPWIWDRLDELTHRRVIDYLSPVVGDTTYPRTNWLWFRIVVQTFLRSVGGPWSAQDIADDLALHDELARADGWLSDGFERSYDHYIGWALHLYPVLWVRMQGGAELAGDRTTADVAALDRFLVDATALVGADGSPLVQGRSLIYRFAAAAPFWAGVIAGVPSTSAGRLRHAADRVVRHFADNGVPDEDGLLSMGWHGEWRKLAQSYSGPGSPYWAVKGLVGISLPADHPVWTAPSEPLPVEAGEVLLRIAAPGWVVSGTEPDGIVRIANHGTDHARQGDRGGDSPLYARIGYSTATAPLVDDHAWREPLEQSVVLVGADDRATHRAAMNLLGTRVDEMVAIAASTSAAHWITPAEVQTRHGSGITGELQSVGILTVQSLLKGPWELRLTNVEMLEPGVAATTVRLRTGGWALAGSDAEVDESSATTADTATVTLDERTSGIRSVDGQGAATIVRRADASPLGTAAAVPVVEEPVRIGVWSATLIWLAGFDAGDPAACRVEVAGHTAFVTWPDGDSTTTRLLDHRPADAADRQ